MPRYCASCILPDSRPGVRLDGDGVCAGCRNAAAKAGLDWTARAIQFEALAGEARAAGAAFDCVIPVSGGKDSFWQVATCLEHGLRPLCLTYVYPRRSVLGEQNLAALRALGVAHRELRLDPAAERHFIARAFREKGISGLVSHMAIYAWPIQVAVAEGIPLVVYGENSAWEYGSEDPSLAGAAVDRRWLARFGVTGGTEAADWADEVLTPKHLAPLVLPSDEALAQSGVRPLFLGHYFPWDPERSRRVAIRHGFRARSEGPRVGHYDFVNIDDDMLGVHHHAKWFKFGITRSWDTLSMEIRAGRLTRAGAIERLRTRGDETPWDDIRQFCAYLGMSLTEYFGVMESFRNMEVWRRVDGRWQVPGFLIPDYPWPSDPLAA